jgi:hypothetical protein
VSAITLRSNDIPSWEKEEADAWLDARNKTGTAGQSVASENPPWLDWQWILIGMFNIFALLNYVEVIPSVYPIYPIGAFELLLRCVFSDLTGYDRRHTSDAPVIAWWFLAFIFPLMTFGCLYLFPYDERRPREKRRRLDMASLWACLLYGAARIITALRPGAGEWMKQILTYSMLLLLTKKIALTLAGLLLLIYVTSDIDLAKNTTRAVDSCVSVFGEDLSDVEIRSWINKNTTPYYTQRTIYYYNKRYHVYGYSKFGISDTAVFGRISAYLWRGNSFDTQKNLIIRSLNRLFGIPPKVVHVQEPAGYRENKYVWRKRKNDGTLCEVRLEFNNKQEVYIVRPETAHNNPLKYLWLKPERIEVSIYVTSI